RGSKSGRIESFIRLKHPAVENHGAGTAEILHGREWRVSGENETAAPAGFDATELLTECQPVRGGAGGRMDDRGRGKTRALHQFEFIEQTESVRHATGAGIAAGQNDHAAIASFQ